MKRPTRKTALREFVGYHFRGNVRSSWNYRSAVNSLNRYAGRDLTLAELDEAMIDQWGAALRERIAAASAKSYVEAILALWRHAATLKAAPPPPPKRLGIPDHREEVLERVRHADASMPVWTFFEAVYRRPSWSARA